MIKDRLARMGISQAAWSKWNKSRALVVQAERPKAQMETIVKNGESTIYLYDVIGYDPWFGGISSEDFVRTVDAVMTPKLNVRMNSPGGYVAEAEAMTAGLDRLRQSGIQVIVHNDGLCASAATFFMASADKVCSSSGAFMMVHNAMVYCCGNKDVLLAQAALMEKIDSTIAGKYVAKCGATMGTVRAWMDAETWFTAQEAADAGFIDEITELSVPVTEPEQESEPITPETATPDNKAGTPVKNYDRERIERRLKLIEALG